MKAIAVVPGEKGTKMIERSEPAIRNPDEVKMKILQTGICGTDREEINGGRAMAPTGQQDLVIGHEMIGRVVEIGNKVTRIRPGDYGIFTVCRWGNRVRSLITDRIKPAELESTGEGHGIQEIKVVVDWEKKNDP